MKEVELLKSIYKKRFEQKIVLSKQHRRVIKRLYAVEQAILQDKEDENYSQFTGELGVLRSHIMINHRESYYVPVWNITSLPMT